MIYLASPYSHPDPAVRRGRFILAAQTASLLTEYCSHAFVYSPITHGHAMHENRELPESWDFWRPRCRAAVMQSREVAFLIIDGWWESVGMATEYQWARDFHIKTRSYLLNVSETGTRHRLIETAYPIRFRVEPRP